MEIVVTVICENTAGISGIMGEHGFSVLIEKGDEKYLFDTGPGRSLEHNLNELGKDLKGLQKLFLSHGHHDHTGGLKWIAERLGTVEVVAHPDVFSEHLLLDSKDGRSKPKYIGSPSRRNELETLGVTFTFIDHTARVTPDIWFVTGLQPDPQNIPRDDRLVVPLGQEFIPDPLRDDASLLLETDQGPVLILGCAHLGILNILAQVEEQMGIHRLHGVLGGTHLKYYGPKDIDRVIAKLDELSVDFVGVSHCTGIRATVELGKHFGERFREGSAGSVFRFSVNRHK
jgi:7,8-dihydropterin-6-yl-methyl-4-(beta-D-ribofuranosyl)aminobenzene 5'-phosphate synthase